MIHPVTISPLVLAIIGNVAPANAQQATVPNIPGVPAAVQQAAERIDPEKIRAHVQFLSDDLLEGRGPGKRGSEIAAKYIATQFALYGLKPGGDNGTYLQQINFVGTKVMPEKTTMSLIPKKPAGNSIDLY